MAKAGVYIHEKIAGLLEKKPTGDYCFSYDSLYLSTPKNPPVSLTLPKSTVTHTSPFLFPFFAGLLAEGINKDIQCQLLRIDENDDFTRLLKTAGNDTIGAVTVKEMPE